MFRNLKKKTKKNQLEKKVKNKFFSSCPSFDFALASLISPTLQITLKKKTTYQRRSQRGALILKIAKNLGITQEIEP